MDVIHEMYDLDIDSMLWIMQDHRVTGRLQTSLPRARDMHIIIEIHQGYPTSYLMISREQVVLSGINVLSLLRQEAILTWTLTVVSQGPSTPQTSSSLPTIATPDPLQLCIPQRATNISLHQLEDRMQRRIFMLIDGKRSAEEIARILNLSSKGTKEMMEILQRLAQKNIITL